MTGWLVDKLGTLKNRFFFFFFKFLKAGSFPDGAAVAIPGFGRQRWKTGLLPMVLIFFFFFSIFDFSLIFHPAMSMFEQKNLIVAAFFLKIVFLVNGFRGGSATTLPSPRPSRPSTASPAPE